MTARYYRVLIVLSVCVNFMKCWDLAVTLEDQIQFFNENGTRLSATAQQFTDMSALHFDDVGQRLFFSDSSHHNGSIFSLDLKRNHETKHLILKSDNDNIQGISYDAVSQVLYWTDAVGRKIFWYSLAEGGNGVGNILFYFDEELPQGIAVDSCRRKLYWTNANHQSPSIERSDLDGKNHEIIIEDDLFVPLGIVIDQTSRRIYWADDKEGIYFQIESADLSGNNRQILYFGKDHQPYNLAIFGNQIYWTDWIYSAVWTISKTATNSSVAPRIMQEFNGNRPMGIVAKHNMVDIFSILPECSAVLNILINRTEVAVQTSDEMQGDAPLFNEITCFNGGELTKHNTCLCKKGFSGNRCEISSCHNYCLIGSCYLPSDGFPKCRCPSGYEGLRCNRDVCDGFCLNGGRCSVEGREAVCTCEGFTGRRCEIKPSIQELCREFCKTGHIYLSGDNDVSACRCSFDGDFVLTSDYIENSTTQHLNIVSGITNQTCMDSFTNPFTLALACVCIILMMTTCFLACRVYHVTRRPRIRKRIIVNKNVTPLTCPPNAMSQAEQCEITIENCCNMNICDTPCFDPVSYRDPREEKKPRKEEKKTLLSSMETGEDLY